MNLGTINGEKNRSVRKRHLCSEKADSPLRFPTSSPSSMSGLPPTTASVVLDFYAQPSNQAEYASPRCAPLPLLVFPVPAAALQRFFVSVSLKGTRSHDCHPGGKGREESIIRQRGAEGQHA